MGQWIEFHLTIRMKITSELLKKYDRCQDSISFFEQNFPDGAEPLEVIEKFPELPESWLYDAKTYFLTTAEEIEKYEELCDIKKCHMTYYSSHLDNCKYISDSTYIKDSSYIFHSTQVSDAHFIYNSGQVERSSEVNYSQNVSNSTLITHSTNVKDSTQICDCDYINWSKDVLYSWNVTDSQFIYKSNNLIDCYFCGFVKNSNHCMFCNAIEDSEYCIFNEKVDRATFERIKEELLFRLEDEKPSFITVNEDALANGNKRIMFTLRFDGVFNGLSNSLYGWIGSLPNYSDEKFLSLFFKSLEI